MSAEFDLILEDIDGFATITVSAPDAAEAWRLARDRYPDRIRGVVRRDARASESALNR
tara:strand:+ start:271 stop:444 length:174 start_codon:yes stop_codon:yes gene_type:complete